MTTVIDPAAASPLIRIERGGGLPDDELAALTLVLLTRAGAQESGVVDGRPPGRDITRWDRPDRHARYRVAGSWRRTPQTRG
ncbi:acyl-CoA carboxylase epsilon subunit [Streptomyces sp. NBC_00344]|uniref:acyl-CoA carboxylase epsilon subunit n=1 Tax=Streptomyces sp. NBC_00344 TaxID=2975720 RepID=UPI002E1DD140